jgi:hypothetical protein
LTYTRAQFPARKAVEGTYEIIIDGQRRFLMRALMSSQPIDAPPAPVTQ